VEDLNKKKSINKIIFCLLAIFLISNFFGLTQSAEGLSANVEIIKVGIWTNNFDGWCYNYDDYTKYFKLFPYDWEEGNKYYRINAVKLGRFNYKKYIDGGSDDIDVFLLDGGSTLEIEFAFKDRLIVQLRKARLRNFINNGGGYVGFCGGGEFPLKFSGEVGSVCEFFSNRNSFLDDEYYDSKVQVKAKYNMGVPVLDEYFYPGACKELIRKPENIGLWSWAWETGAYPEPKAVPMNLKLTDEGKSHPIFSDYTGDNIYIGWAGGPAYDLDSVNNPDVLSLAKYDDSLTNDEETKIYAWSFQPINSLFSQLSKIFEMWLKIYNYDCPDDWTWDELVDWFFSHIMNLKGWKYTGDKQIFAGFNDVDENKDPAFVTIDNYGNGRLVMSGIHPMQQVFDKSEKDLEPNNETAFRPGTKHLYRWWDEETNDWVDDSQMDSSGMDWLLLRSIAWASGKVDDEHLPPIFEVSHTIDFESLSQPEEFTIDCAVETQEDWDAAYLDLFYRYNDVNTSNWTDWILYEYDGVVNSPWDYNSHNPWTIEFDVNKAKGTGEYEFYSRLVTEQNSTSTIENAPSSADSRCFAGVSGFADIDYSSKDPLVNQHISFSDQSEATNPIETWSWDFGEGNTSSSQNPEHDYVENQNYTVTLNVTDTESNYYITSVNVTVHNNKPTAQFSSTPSYIVIGSNPRVTRGGSSKTISFQSSSSDSDGTISNTTWDFGEGNEGYGLTVNHSYNISGYHPVTLRVKDDDSSTDEASDLNCVLVVNGLVNETLPSDDPDNFTWNSVQKAFDNLTTNDILYILNGTYTENLTLNKSVILYGENRFNTSINGSIKLVNPRDHELIENSDYDGIVNMSGNNLLFHFNNDTSYGEDYSSSSVVVDFSGQKNNGTIYGPSWKNSSIKGPGALLFDGQGDSVNLSNISALSGENVTISSWIYWIGGSGNSDPILSQSNTSSGYLLYVNCSNNDKPAFKLGNDEAVSSVNLSTGWHLIVGTHNQTQLVIYVDGISRGNQSKTGTGASLNAFVGFDNTSSYFNGTIDEVAVWNRTLSGEEISTMYQANYGTYLNNIEIQNGTIGINSGNHSIIKNCRLINSTVGIDFNNTWDVIIENCYISGGSYGIKVSNNYTGEYNRNYIINTTIENTSTGIQVNSSSNLSIADSYLNCTNNIQFNITNFSNINVIWSDSWGNVAPDTPCKVYNGSTLGDPGTTYSYKTKTNDSNAEQILYQFDWGDGNTSGWLGPYTSNETVEASHSWAEEGGYYITVKAKDAIYNESNSSEPLLFRTEMLPPLINSVNHTPSIVGFGGNITITANVTDNKSSNWSGIQNVSVNITYPETSSANYTMNSIGNNTYEYIFNNTWLVGLYNYTIWAVDNAYNTNSSTGHSFNVSAHANISVCTLKNEYGDEEQILLTDPPNGDPPLISYEFLDGGDVLHIWNKYDSYYFDTDTGIQLTNHYNEYWSHNVLMLGYYNNNQWNLMYRTDELSGFNKEIDTDNETYINVTMWKNLEYQGYDFRLAIRYYLGVDDNELTVIPHIKNIDQSDIPYVLGFGWEMKDIQIDMTTTGDYVDVNGTMYYLNQTLNNTYTDLSEAEFYLMENITDSQTKSLYLKWNQTLTYKLQVKSRENQYNAPVTLFVRIGTLASGQEKYTKMYWYDAAQATYYFNNYDFREVWTNNPNYMVDGSTSNYASTSTDTDVELCDENNCSGTDLGVITKVEIRVHGYFTGDSRNIILRPVFGGTTDGSNNNFQAPTAIGAWSPWFDITSGLGSTWSWTDVDNLDCDVEMGTGMLPATVYASKVEVRVTYNIAPVVSNPVPADGSTNITPKPVLNITVSDSDGNSMNITWYTNSSPSTLTLRPNANGSSTQLGRHPAGSSTNYACVDEATYNDSDYVKLNGTSWKNDTYEIQNHSGETGNIHFIKVNARCARIGSAETANTSSYARITINSGGKYYYSHIFKPPRSNTSPGNFTNYSYIWTFNPSSGNVWSWSDIDNLEAGISFIGNQGTSRCSQVYVEVNYTNSSAPWVTFGTNNSVGNGTYHQTFTNASMNGRWWYWKVYVHDGKAGVYSGVYKFYTGRESKIENTGSTNISGYLLIQVQYYNTTNSTWVVADDAVNETTARMINSGGKLGLDTVFNGLVDTKDLSDYGNGTYRIYAALRDPDGDVLICNNDTELKATHEFTITFE
jgi:hypothetical protein